MRQLPKEVKEIQGTYEASREGFNPVEYDQYERIPAPPKKWPPDVEKIWRERCYDLKNSGYLARAFVPTLEAYCDWWGIYFDAYNMVKTQGAIIAEEGSQGQMKNVVNPAFQVMDKAMKHIESINSKYGFTPLDIQKIPVIRKAEENVDSLLK
jgi:P27 family predicted phage terminase small subunit